MVFTKSKKREFNFKKELGFVLKQVESFKDISDLYEIFKLIGERLEKLGIATVITVPDKRKINLIVKYLNQVGLVVHLPYKEGDKLYLNNLKNYKRAKDVRKSIFFSDNETYFKRMLGQDNSQLKQSTNSIISPLILRGEIVAFVELFSNEINISDTTVINSFSRELVVRIANMILFREVKKSEERYKNLFEKAKDGFYILNARQRKFVDVNESLCKMSGYTRIELLQMNSIMLFDSSERKRIEAYIEKRIKTEGGKIKNGVPRNYETKILTKNKEVFDIEINVMQFASRDEWFVSVRDITEKKKIKKDLLESTRKYQLLAQNVSDLIFVVDTVSWDFSYFSPSVKRILGYQEDELLGTNMAKLLTAKSYRKALKKIKAELLSDGQNNSDKDNKASVMFELEKYHKNGNVVIMEITASLMLNAEGKEEGIMMVGRDITKRKKAEDALLKSEKRYRSVFENSGNAIITVDSDNIIKTANTEFQKLSGYKIEEIEGQVVWTNFIERKNYRKIKNDVWQKKKQIVKSKKEYNLIFIDRFNEEKNVIVDIAPIQGAEKWVISFVDYTQLKKTEDAFRRSEKNYEELLTNASDIIISTNSKGYLIFANKAFKEISGYNDVGVEKLHFSKLIHPDDYNRVAERFVKRLKGVDVDKFIEFKAIVKNGDIRIMNMTSTPVIEKKKIVGTQSILRDVTENRLLLQQVKKSKRHYEQVIDAIDDAICVMNENLVIISANQSFAKKVNMDIATIKNSKCGEVLPRYETNLFYKNCKSKNCNDSCRIVQIFNSKKNSSFVEKSVGKNKNLHYHRVSIFHNYKSEIGKSEVVLVIRDITKEKIVEDEMIKLNDLNKSIMDNIPVSIITLEKKGKIISSNKYITDLIKGEILVGKSIYDMALTKENDLIKKYENLLLYGRSFTKLNCKTLNKQGKDIYVNIIAVPIRDSFGKTNGAVSMAWDNTESKFAKEKIELLNERLEKKAVQRTWQLDQANRELAKVLELKSKFISDASHELRTPLTIIQGNLDLSIHAAKVAGGDINEEYQTIYKEVQRMSGILTELTLLTNIDADRVNLEYEPVFLAALIKNTVNALQVLAKQKNIKLKIKNKTFPKNLYLRGDEVKLEKLLMNLVRNAIKYTEEGGWILLALKRGKIGVEIRVEDNGIGIPEQDLPYIFERFYRVDKARSREEGGTGLGLSISKWIVEAHNGKIGVDSKEGVGTTFSVLLPYDCKKESITGELL